MSYFSELIIKGRNLGKTAQVSPMRALSAFEQIRLCGTTFHGTTKDTNFWSETGTGAGGTVTQTGGQVTLSVNATNNSKAVYNSVRTGRYVPGTANKFRVVIQLPDVGSAGNNNVRNWGAFSATDGFFFQLNGATFNVVSRKASSDTPVAKASWNGKYAVSTTIGTTVHTYEIQYTNSAAWFFIDDNLVHTISASTTPSTGTLTLPIGLENINTGVGAVVTLNVRVASIMRMGHYLTTPTYKNITTGGGYPLTTVCKYNAGTLHRVVINQPTAASQTAIIYDNTSALAPVIGTIELKNTVTHFEYGCPFFNGLTIVTSAACNITIIYE